MDSFIKFWSKILIENPDFNMNFLSDSIYKNLTRWYDTEEELTHDNRSCGNFDEWINYFDKKDNIEVDIDKEWSYFIQFVKLIDKLIFLCYNVREINFFRRDLNEVSSACQRKNGNKVRVSPFLRQHPAANPASVRNVCLLHPDRQRRPVVLQPRP